MTQVENMPYGLINLNQLIHFQYKKEVINCESTTKFEC